MARAGSTVVLLALVLIARTSAHGTGVWKDPNHYVNDKSLAGIRLISEGPPHHLRIVGTDDGTNWWALSGSCANGADGSIMTQITIDFSPKGGPKSATGVWAEDKSTGLESITWPDHNKWTLMPTPSPAVTSDDALADHAGFFKDPHHYKEGTWAGVRVIAEYPPHVLTMIGSDDGNTRNLWSLAGDCTGPDMTNINFDFSPKGGPAKLTGIWAAPTRTISWPDGNVWVKFGAFSKTAAAEELRTVAAGPASAPQMLPRLFGVAVLASVAAAALFLRRKISAAGTRPLPL